MRSIPALLLTSALLLSPLAAEAASGCCSQHGGVDSCDVRTGYYLYKDGTDSPSCTCDGTTAPPLRSRSASFASRGTQTSESRSKAGSASKPKTGTASSVKSSRKSVETRKETTKKVSSHASSKAKAKVKAKPIKKMK